MPGGMLYYIVCARHAEESKAGDLIDRWTRSYVSARSLYDGRWIRSRNQRKSDQTLSLALPCLLYLSYIPRTTNHVYKHVSSFISLSLTTRGD